MGTWRPKEPLSSTSTEPKSELLRLSGDIFSIPRPAAYRTQKNCPSFCCYCYCFNFLNSKVINTEGTHGTQAGCKAQSHLTGPCLVLLERRQLTSVFPLPWDCLFFIVNVHSFVCVAPAGFQGHRPVASQSLGAGHQLLQGLLMAVAVYQQHLLDPLRLETHVAELLPEAQELPGL